MSQHKTREDGKHKIQDVIEGFLIDRRLYCARSTVNWYSAELGLFREWCDKRLLYTVEDITSDTAKLYFLDCGQRCKAGGLHAKWRAIKVWFAWFDREFEPLNWRNPMLKIPGPKISREPLPGISREDFDAMIATCHKDFYGTRNRAVLLFLLDTGSRATETCNVRVGDVDFSSGTVFIRQGKGGKSRSVFLGTVALQSLSRWFRIRGPYTDDSPLFCHMDGAPIKNKKGLESIMIRHAKLAGLARHPKLHDFRRTFTIESLRNNADILSISRQLGHSDISLVQRYARQTTEDLRDVHAATSPADNMYRRRA